MVDSVYRTRSLGVAAAGIPDQYADGKAAKVWEYYIGGSRKRTAQYREFFCNLLRENGVEKVLDVACGNGVDSILLLEEGFKVTSIDASDKMLKYALKTRWQRRKEPAFDGWVIEEGNWLAVRESDISIPDGGFDAVICLGNSFAHLPDFTGDQENHKIAIKNFHDILKPGGLLFIDHRNYDAILDSGKASQRNLYYNSDRIVDITTSVLHVNGKPKMITLDYVIDGTDEAKAGGDEAKDLSKFRLSYYPHRLKKFQELLQTAFGKETKHVIWGDFEPQGEVAVPAYYIHMIQKSPA